MNLGKDSFGSVRIVQKERAHAMRFSGQTLVRMVFSTILLNIVETSGNKYRPSVRRDINKDCLVQVEVFDDTSTG